MKLLFKNKAPDSFMNVIHPSGYTYKDEMTIIPIKRNEKIFQQKIDLKEMWLHLNYISINEIDWSYDESTDREGFSIDNKQIRLDLVNKYGFANIAEKLSRRESEGIYYPDFDITEYEEKIDLYDFLLVPFHQYSYQYKNSNKQVYDLLKDNGVFLLHTIGSKGKPFATNPWIRKYIFPGGYIPSLSEIIKVTEKNNVLITDIEVLRLHYAKTLKHWYKNFVKNRKKIIEMFDERFCRMWEFYLLASHYSFVNMGNVVFQIQISKNINNLPLTRNYMYN